MFQENFDGELVELLFWSRCVVRAAETLLDGCLPGFEGGGLFCHALGFLCGEVGGFLRILGNVVELHDRERLATFCALFVTTGHGVGVKFVRLVEQSGMAGLFAGVTPKWDRLRARLGLAIEDREQAESVQEVGCLEFGMPVVTRVAPTLIVSHDEHDVRTLGGERRNIDGCNEREEQEQESSRPHEFTVQKERVKVVLK